MLPNTITLKTVEELLNENFFIPSYQRGYKWTEKQVEDLLNDINAANLLSDPDKWYCLQPIVVKKITHQNDKYYEVIDGQQRLTTIALIIHYYRERWNENTRAEPSIEYQTRTDSAQFIQNLKRENADGDKNIDFFHLSRAYKAIYQWMEQRPPRMANTLIDTLIAQTKVIWYEVNDGQDGRDIFTRINLGKIPLTNAELIKALFLNSSNFNALPAKPANKIPEDIITERIRLKQLEIATEWDAIEASLRNEEFWWFINKDSNNLSSRIEFIFELLVGADQNKNNKNTDEYSTFREYQKRFGNPTEETISKNWAAVKHCFNTLQDWFEDRELYHKIGFLITVSDKLSIAKLMKKGQTQTKTAFKDYLETGVKQTLKTPALGDLEYDKDKKIIRNVLLLHNILTLLANKECNTRFQFKRYKEEKWDIEHIHAIATEFKDLKTQTETKGLLEEYEELAKEIAKFIQPDSTCKEQFSEFSEKIRKHFSENEDSFKDEDSLHSLHNLALLDQSTNRGYKNAPFPTKRQEILQKEKSGTLVPICTKNVFMKLYTDQPKQMKFWGVEDRKAYLEDIERHLKPYLPTNT